MAYAANNARYIACQCHLDDDKQRKSLKFDPIGRRQNLHTARHKTKILSFHARRLCGDTAREQQN